MKEEVKVCNILYLGEIVLIKCCNLLPLKTQSKKWVRMFKLGLCEVICFFFYLLRKILQYKEVFAIQRNNPCGLCSYGWSNSSLKNLGSGWNCK